MSKDDSAATRPRLDALVLTPRAGSAILQRAVLSGRFTAGCPSGQRERSVKPSAQPTLVRTQHLPLPAKTVPGLGILRPCGPSCVVSSCVIVGQETPLRGGGYGHMADGIGPEPAVHRTACCALPGPSPSSSACARAPAPASERWPAAGGTPK